MMWLRSFVALCVVAAADPQLVIAQATGCRRASETLEGVRRDLAMPSPDYREILGRLQGAMDLCPGSGELFRIAACTADALKDPRARMWRDRAVLNRASGTACGEFVAAGQVAAAPLPSYVSRKYALVVGLGAFRDATIPPLRFPAKDANDLQRALVDPRVGRFTAENVWLLTNELATRKNILGKLNELTLTAREDDLVLIYMSSHGSPSKDDAGLAGVGYIVTYDTDKNRLWDDAIEYQSLASIVSRIKARRKVLFLDTCFSGQAAKAGSKSLVLEPTGVAASTARLFLSGEGTYVIASSKPNEMSWESDQLSNSYFTYFLIEALKKEDPPPTVKQLFEQLSRKVTDAVAKEKQAPQHPVIYPETSDTELRIGVKPRTDNDGGPR